MYAIYIVRVQDGGTTISMQPLATDCVLEYVTARVEASNVCNELNQRLEDQEEAIRSVRRHLGLDELALRALSFFFPEVASTYDDALVTDRSDCLPQGADVSIATLRGPLDWLMSLVKVCLHGNNLRGLVQLISPIRNT
jgi:hypothetical protein